MMSSQPLTGVRIADFTWVGAGAFTTKLLADHGADVIKVESHAKIDGLRLSPPFKDGEPGVNRSGYFADRNSSKRSLALNLKTDEGQMLARDLITRCDIVANNFTPGIMEKFGLGYEQVRELKPDIIYLSMSMQGSTGPERDYLGYGQTIAAMVGLQHLTGLPHRMPIGTGTNYPDHIPNPAHAAFAVLAALRHRRRTGEGQLIDLAQTEPTISVLATSILEASVNGSAPGRMGNAHRRWAPHGVFQCAGEDEWIALAVTNDAQWAALVDTLDLTVPEEWGAEAVRKESESELDSLLACTLVDRSAADLAGQLRAAGVPAGKVKTARDVLDDDQLLFRKHWISLDHPEMGETIYGGPPFRFSKTPGGLRGPAPCLGQHTREVCQSVLGLNSAQIDRLEQEGVLT